MNAKTKSPVINSSAVEIPNGLKNHLRELTREILRKNPSSSSFDKYGNIIIHF